MLTYFLLTAVLMLLSCIFSGIAYVMRQDNAAFVRAFGELALSLWGFWLASRVLA